MTQPLDRGYLEELITRISKKLVDEFLKEVLVTLTRSIIDLKEQVAELAAGQKALQEQVAELAAGQKALQEQVAKLAQEVRELAKAQARTQRALRRLAISHRRLVNEFRAFKSWVEDLFGRWSHFVGAGAEAMIRDIFRQISMSGKEYMIDDLSLPPLKDLRPLKKKKDGYQFDLVGVAEDGRIWIIEVKTQAVSSDIIVDSMLKSLRRWVSDNPAQKFVYVVFALGGIERGLDSKIVRSVKSIGGDAIIFDRFQSIYILRDFGYPV